MREHVLNSKYSQIDVKRLEEQELVGNQIVEKMILEARFETRPDRMVDQRLVSDIVSNNNTFIADHISTYSAKAKLR